MNSILRLSVLLSLTIGTLSAADDSFHAPDSLVLKNGQTVRGLILKNTRDTVVLQEKYDEKTYEKSDIVRIRDEANVGVEYTDINRLGDFPSWRVIANDLRSNDAVKSFVEVPATIIDNGEFKNIPYKSFRINGDVELNIYGDPEDPSAIELGIYGSKSSNDKLRKTLRAYLAGFLTTRGEVGALYALDFKGGLKTVGDVTLEIIPKDAPDSYGAWWITLYNKTDLARIRLDDAEYAKLVRPMDEVFDKTGRIIANGWTSDQLGMSEKINQLGDSAAVLLRGFYRDKNGDFRLITDKESLPPLRN